MARVKKKEHEKLEDSNILHVIGLLEQNKPITKKEACAILNISYNTTRLNKILEGYKTRKENEKKQRDKKKGTPASEDEIQDVIKACLDGENITEIAKQLYRSSSFVVGILSKAGVPRRPSGDAKNMPSILPDDCVKEVFSEGETAWSAKYHAPCVIMADMGEHSKYESKYGCRVYKIWVIEPLNEPVEYFPRVTIGGFYASSPAYNLGSLQHLKEYGVNLDV